MKTLKLGLCAGRHTIDGIQGYIFEEIKDVTDVGTLFNEAYTNLKELENGKLCLYVTGLTVALIEVLNACKFLNIKVQLYRFNRETNSYFKQNVI